MANIDLLAEQHIRTHESQLKHIDEVMEKAQHEDSATESVDRDTALQELARHRKELASYIDELKQKAPYDWMEEGGPMVMWDIMAERIEELVERIEH